MQKLRSNFSNRKDLLDYVASISPWLNDFTASEILGGKIQAEEKLNKIDPISYCKNRNYLDGSVTKLSPYIRHGILSLNEVRNFALEKSDPKQIEKFIQELAWRDFWQRIYFSDPDKIWHDIEEYKTGYQKEDYADNLPQDILEAKTVNACINQFINQLTKTGYLHNHARMYLASYSVHWRKTKWQAGAKWFLHHLLDGDPASNNLSWQWIASTFSSKPYIFNLENVAKYCANSAIDFSKENNPELNFSYEELEQKLFKKL
ncbi:MAG: DNA photolyase [Proteobacteria bacterium]|nr:DNA photolyase [Pseudomonadota bacterium]